MSLNLSLSNKQSNPYFVEIDKIHNDINQLQLDTPQLNAAINDIVLINNDVTQLKTDTTDISYDLTSDTTTISNRLKIESALNATNGNYPMLRVINTEATINNEARLYVASIAGSSIGNSLAKAGDIVLQCYNDAPDLIAPRAITLSAGVPNDSASRYTERGIRMDLADNGLLRFVSHGGIRFESTSYTVFYSSLIIPDGGSTMNVGGVITTARNDITALKTKTTNQTYTTDMTSFSNNVTVSGNIMNAELQNATAAIAKYALCTLTCNGAGTYSMSLGSVGFKAFNSSGYILEVATGKIKLLLDSEFLGLTDTNFQVSVTGAYNSVLNGGDIMLCSVGSKNAYSDGGVTGYEFTIITTRTLNSTTLTDITDTGFLDVMVRFS